MPLLFELVTPARLVMSDYVHQVDVPGSEGEFGVLEGHAPFATTIKDGVIRIWRTAGGPPEEIAVKGGFAEVSTTGLTVLSEQVG